jgi:CRP-like cAMP-binding protein
MEDAEIHRVLKSSEFLNSLAEEEFQKISKICQMADYASGAYLFRQGDYGEHLYVIAAGYVFIERTVDIGQHKGYVVIDALGRGQTLGCWSTLLGQPHQLMSSANCQKPSRFVVIDGPKLRDRMLENSNFGFKILERLCFLLQNRIQAAYGAMDKI